MQKHEGVHHLFNIYNELNISFDLHKFIQEYERTFSKDEQAWGGRLERWLRDSNLLLSLQRSQVQLPAPILETSYPYAVSFQDLTPSSDLCSHLPVYGAYANTQAHTH